MSEENSIIVPVEMEDNMVVFRDYCVPVSGAMGALITASRFRLSSFSQHSGIRFGGVFNFIGALTYGAMGYTFGAGFAGGSFHVYTQHRRVLVAKKSVMDFKFELDQRLAEEGLL
eukprot:TRINITY_DN556_c0_g1_i1.p1 TRINITY_DN556_c0_g1~~TRINITY_DN556_c0_g1_i1.p1  ORF type:complete len:115 (-),score=17.87 TRINITY_DN556_c0_g1_i1:65-409(-)